VCEIIEKEEDVQRRGRRGQPQEWEPWQRVPWRRRTSSQRSSLQRSWPEMIGEVWGKREVGVRTI